MTKYDICIIFSAVQVSNLAAVETAFKIKKNIVNEQYWAILCILSMTSRKNVNDRNRDNFFISIFPTKKYFVDKKYFQSNFWISFR